MIWTGEYAGTAATHNTHALTVEWSITRMVEMFIYTFIMLILIKKNVKIKEKLSEINENWQTQLKVYLMWNFRWQVNICSLVARVMVQWKINKTMVVN